MDGLMLTVITFHVIAFAMLSFIGFLAYKLGKVTIRGLVALGTKVGASPLVSLICFAIAVAMFPEPVTYVVNAVSNSSLFVFEEYLPRLNEIPSFETNDSVGPELLTRTTWITGYLLYALKGLITNLQLWRFPLVQTIFLLSTWLALAAAVTAAVRTIGDRVRAERTGADEVVKKVQSPTLKNVGLFALLGMGIYFSLTATAAIPSFKEAVIPAEFKSDKFKDWLNGLKLQDKELVAAFPDEGTLDDQSKLYWSSAKSTYLQEQDRLAKVYEALYQADYHRKGQGQTLEYHRDLTLDYLGRTGQYARGA